MPSLHRTPLLALAALALLVPATRATTHATVERAPLWAATQGGHALHLTNPAALRAERVVLDVAALEQAADQGDLSAPLGLTLFGEAHELQLLRVDHVQRHRVLFGRLDGSGDSEFALALGEEGVAAAAVRLGTREFALRYAGDGATHVLEEHSAALHGAAHASCGVGPEHLVGAPGDAGSEAGPDARAGVPTLVDVAVFYTPLARQNGGGVSGIEAQIALQVGRATQACRDSGVDQEFRLVYTAETSYAEVGNNTDLSRFRGTNDGYMDEVHAARTTYGADVMALIVDFATGYCGVGYLMTNVSTSFASSAFSVTVRDCLASNTLAHEMGHNIGCHHDRANASGRGAYSYSFGHRCIGGRPIAVEYRSVMAYPPGVRVGKWSSPTVLSSPNGCTLGANNDDNARSINNTKGTTSRFRSTKLYEWIPSAGTGIPGTSGQPTLTGTGHIDGTTIPIELTVANSPAGAPGLLVLGYSRLDLPALGGTIVPALDILQPIAGSAAPIVLNASFLQTFPPGTEVFLQAFFLDAGAIQGVAASDGVMVTAL